MYSIRVKYMREIEDIYIDPPIHGFDNNLTKFQALISTIIHYFHDLQRNQLPMNTNN